MEKWYKIKHLFYINTILSTLLFYIQDRVCSNFVLRSLYYTDKVIICNDKSAEISKSY